uniref:Putative secreted peptide n=1 Tax=Rhipicephalus pulchellus TaxID=72859 RepID=L7MC87_RHIPC
MKSDMALKILLLLLAPVVYGVDWHYSQNAADRANLPSTQRAHACKRLGLCPVRSFPVYQVRVCLFLEGNNQRVVQNKCVDTPSGKPFASYWDPNLCRLGQIFCSSIDGDYSSCVCEQRQ